MTAVLSENELRAHHVFVKTDNPFQRAVRLRQALWREEQGYPVGLHRGQPLGSRLTLDGAEEILRETLDPQLCHPGTLRP